MPSMIEERTKQSKALEEPGTSLRWPRRCTVRREPQVRGRGARSRRGASRRRRCRRGRPGRGRAAAARPRARARTPSSSRGVRPCRRAGRARARSAADVPAPAALRRSAMPFGIRSILSLDAHHSWRRRRRAPRRRCTRTRSARRSRARRRRGDRSPVAVEAALAREADRHAGEAARPARRAGSPRRGSRARRARRAARSRARRGVTAPSVRGAGASSSGRRTERTGTPSRSNTGARPGLRPPPSTLAGRSAPVEAAKSSRRWRCAPPTFRWSMK